VTLTLVGQQAERAEELRWQASAPGKVLIPGTGIVAPPAHDLTARSLLGLPDYHELSDAEREGLAYKASLRGAQPCSGDYRPATVCDLAVVRLDTAELVEEPHWWRGAAGGLLLIGLLGVVLRGSREA